MSHEIGLFIDFENIRLGLLSLQKRDLDPRELIQIARGYGTVMVSRAYADWTRQPEPYKGKLLAAMIDRVDCPVKRRERYQGGGFHQKSAAPALHPRSTDREPCIQTVSDPASEQFAARYGELSGAQTRFKDFASLAVLLPPRATREQEGLAPRVPLPGENIAEEREPSFQSTVDANMLLDVIETVLDRPTIDTFILVTGDRDFTRISARLKIRLNKTVIIVGVPGAVSKDLINASSRFVPLMATEQSAAHR